MNHFLYIAVLPQLLFPSSTQLNAVTTSPAAIVATTTPTIVPATPPAILASTTPIASTSPKATTTPVILPATSTIFVPDATTTSTTTKEKPHTATTTPKAATSTPTASGNTITGAPPTFNPTQASLIGSVPAGVGDIYARSQPFTAEQTRLFLSIALALATAGILLVEQSRLRGLSRRLDQLFTPRIEIQR
jgi:hypothetical protein